MALKVLTAVVLCLYGANALPASNSRMGTLFGDAIMKTKEGLRIGNSSDGNINGWPCFNKYCKPPKDMKYKRLQSVTPRIQWMNAGGYCGSMAIQDVSLGKGVWISQQQVRDHTVPGGGHDNEILATNIELALKNLKLSFEAFDYKNQPVPQADAYRTFLKKHLVKGNGIAWMIMLQGGCYPVYPGLPYGFYSHVEPVYGIYSNHPLTEDGKWYDDDIIVHGTDADQHSYYRRFDSLPAGVNSHNCSDCGGGYVGYPCIDKDYGFGYAITGLNDEREGLPLSLAVDDPQEPNTREGQKPKPLHGAITVSEIQAGGNYTIYRWDSVESAFDISKASSSHNFIGESGSTYVYNDPMTIMSNSTTYYRCYEES